jgi:hypothetical protein
MLNPTIQEYLDDMHLEVPWTEGELKPGDDMKLLMKAFRELKEKLHEYADLTVPYKERISVKDLKVQSFISVRRATVPAGLNVDNTSVGNVFTALAGMSAVPNSGAYHAYFDRYTQLMLCQSIKNTVSEDLQYLYDQQNQCLYVAANVPKPTYVTITYIPEYDDPSELKTKFAQSQLRKLAVAYMKIHVGSKRRKVRLPNSPAQLDGEALLSEGLEELREVRSYLVQNNTPQTVL